MELQKKRLEFQKMIEEEEVKWELVRLEENKRKCENENFNEENIENKGSDEKISVNDQILSEEKAEGASVKTSDNNDISESLRDQTLQLVQKRRIILDNEREKDLSKRILFFSIFLISIIRIKRKNE
jgi:hypothetical protein